MMVFLAAKIFWLGSVSTMRNIFASKQFYRNLTFWVTPRIDWALEFFGCINTSYNSSGESIISNFWRRKFWQRFSWKITTGCIFRDLWEHHQNHYAWIKPAISTLYRKVSIETLTNTFHLSFTQEWFWTSRKKNKY